MNIRKFPILETERLILRSQDMKDAEALYELRSDERVMQFIDRPRPKDITDIENLIRQINMNFESGHALVWTITLKENPAHMIGSIGYFSIDPDNFRGEIGYMLYPDHWRKGIVSEALHCAIDFGFNEMNLHKIRAIIKPGNDASRQMLLKHGFEKEAYFKEDYYFNGKFLDSEMYGRINPSS